MTIKVCFFSSLSSLSTGMPICTAATIALVAADPGFAVSVILPKKGALSEYLEKRGIAVTYLKFERLSKAGGILSIIRFVALFVPAFFHFCLFIQKRRFDIVHFSDLIDAPFYPAAIFCKARVVAHLRLNLENPVMLQLLRFWSLLFTHKIIAVSNAVQRRVSVSPSRCKVIYDPGPDPELFNPDRHFDSDLRFPGKSDIIHVCASASFRPGKGHDNILRVALTASQKSSVQFLFSIIGGKVKNQDEYFTHTMSMIKELKLSDRIQLLGELPHDSIPDVLFHSDIFIHLPTCQEGLGVSIIEAMQMMVPVVVFDSGGTRECFTDEASGFLVKQGDIETAAQRVVKLAQDASLRQRMGEYARKEALDRFNGTRHKEEIVGIYRSIL